MGKIKKILSTELLGNTGNDEIYPITSTKAVFDEDNVSLDTILKNIQDLPVGELESIKEELQNAKDSIDTLESNYTDLNSSVSNLNNTVESEKNSKGKANGIATLDSNGDLKSEQLPSSAKNVILLHGIINSNSQLSTTTFPRIKVGELVLCLEDSKLYSYTSVSGREWVSYNEKLLEKDTLYIVTSSNNTIVNTPYKLNTQWWWNGSSLVNSNIVIGDTSGTAYDGEKGKTLETNLGNPIDEPNESGSAFARIAFNKAKIGEDIENAKTELEAYTESYVDKAVTMREGQANGFAMLDEVKQISINNLPIIFCTEDEYNELEEKDENKLYYIYEK